MKPLAIKVQDAQRLQRHGIVVTSYAELRRKGCQKLGISSIEDIRVCLETDGTDISDDSFLQHLESNVVVVFLRNGERWMGYWSYVMNAFDQAKKIHPLYQAKEKIESSLNLETDNEKLSTIATFLTSLNNNRDLKNRKDDPGWFEGLPATAKVKEKVMKDGAKSRVKGYYYSSKKAVQGLVTKAEYDKYFASIFQKFTDDLVRDDHYSGYFGREDSEDIRLCDELGWFNCEGPFDAHFCSSTHLINPYDNKESRIVFSTWNLDHQIEKTRAVVPALIAAVRDVKRGFVVNVGYFYGLFFTKVNLRLVHIVCHKKSEHESKKVDPKMVHTRAQKESEKKSRTSTSKEMAVPGKRRSSRSNGA